MNLKRTKSGYPMIMVLVHSDDGKTYPVALDDSGVEKVLAVLSNHFGNSIKVLGPIESVKITEEE